jgi:hypothetical protein
MKSSSHSTSQSGLFLKAAALVAVVAVIRYFMKGWLAPLGVPVPIGSLVSSITIVLLVTTVLLFFREGRKPEGRYLKAAAWFVPMVLWCQGLIICGILLTEKTGKDTYYSGPWEIVHERFPTPAAHAIGHTQGTVAMIFIGLLLGGIIYVIARRGRQKAAAPAAA